MHPRTMLTCEIGSQKTGATWNRIRLVRMDESDMAAAASVIPDDAVPGVNGRGEGNGQLPLQ